MPRGPRAAVSRVAPPPSMDIRPGSQRGQLLASARNNPVPGWERRSLPGRPARTQPCVCAQPGNDPKADRRLVLAGGGLPHRCSRSTETSLRC